MSELPGPRDLQRLPARVRSHPRAFVFASLAAAWAIASVLSASLALGISIGFDDEGETHTHTLVVAGVASDGQPQSYTDLALAAAASTGPEKPGDIVFQSPLQDWSLVTDRFGAPRPNDRTHSGIDLGLGTMPHSPVYSACAGRVVVAGEDPGYGLFVVINCGEGWSVLTAHFSEILVEEGQVVGIGHQIGVSGSTGYSTGEHLHFEVRKNGVAYNPELYLDFHVPPDAPLTLDTVEPLEPSPEDVTDPEATPADDAATPDGEATDTPSPDPTATCTPAPGEDSGAVPASVTRTPSATEEPSPSPSPSSSSSPSPSSTPDVTETPTPTPTDPGWDATPPRSPSPTVTPSPEPCGS